MKEMVFGSFENKDHAEMAISELTEIGIGSDRVSVIMKEGSVPEGETKDTGEKLTEGVLGGAVTGTLIGGVIGLAAIAIPGLGALLIGGPIAAALGLGGAAATTVSGAVTGALAGGLVGALGSLGIPEEQAREYDRQIREGGVLVGAEANQENAAEVQDILASHGAENITRSTPHIESGQEEYGYGRAYPHEVDSPDKEEKDEDKIY